MITPTIANNIILVIDILGPNTDILKWGIILNNKINIHVIHIELSIK